MKINKKTYKIDKQNFYQTKNKKEQIILAGSLRKENYHIKRLQKKEYGKTKKWCTYSISRNGEIYQHYDPQYYSDFMGNKNIDRKSISIVLENMGMVFYDYELNTFLNWVHEECHEDDVFERNWKGSRYWEIYTSEQMDATVELCNYLCNKYDIPLDCLGFNVYHEDTIKFNGIVTRSNYDTDYNDLNPHFDWKLFLDKLGIE